MDPYRLLMREHHDLTRRYFLRAAPASIAALKMGRTIRAAESTAPESGPRPEYLTRPSEFGTVERGDPLPYRLPLEKRRAIGLERETWSLEVVPDPESDAKVERPLSKALGTALDWEGLMRLADQHAVRYLKVMTCLNMAKPLGMGLWEGVPLRDVIWRTRPVENIRRAIYHGHHNEDPEQLFESSLPIGRVLEDPPGMPPVLLCYKLNGQWLSGKRGGPVRVLVPETYGFKSIKWLKRVVLTNLFHANDTYAERNNDIDTWLKTFARFVAWPQTIEARRPVPVSGIAQVGISGLARVQVWLRSLQEPMPADDPYFTKGHWRDVDLLGSPTNWGGGLPNGKLPGSIYGFDADRGRPLHWPMRYTWAHWAGVLPGLPAGDYEIRCRTIDEAGRPQPMPRPFRKSGRNAIQRVVMTVEA